MRRSIFLRRSISFLSTFLFLSGLFVAQNAAAQAGSKACIDCHSKTSPGIVHDWRLSKHSKNGVACPTCHGSLHKTAADYAKAKIPTPETCAACHPKQFDQFKSGKHALAWVAMKAMPTIHWQPMAMIEGMKGCGGCHQIGLKSKQDIMEIKKTQPGFGITSCDVCHTRHLFSVKEARSPQACRTCHTGFDHPQWEMYEGSKHGVRYALKREGILPRDAAAPTCQECHMANGNHEVRTAWGFLGLRLPPPGDKQWAADQVTILKGLGVLDPQGKPTALLAAVKAADLVRLTAPSWQHERDRMLTVCTRCHSLAYAKSQLALGDKIIKDSDHLMAEAIRTVAALYKDGVLKKPSYYPYAYPDLLTFHNAPTPIEQKLFVMFSEHRMRTFQGAFHANPDYAFWYGWSAMATDLTDIKSMAAQLRRQKASAGGI
ncbi:MAG: multiheme c-type cytochrome [Nitrospiraceae bacterium]|nr:multiheme c-type cytochrome [Nitrospiraceae bacterium]